MIDRTFDNILPRVVKPARYTGGEYNAVWKAHDTVDVRFALAFPDTYEIGMSNLGVRILYEILNARADTVAERVFAPWVDMEAEMRTHGLPLFGLESRTPVRDFDIIGFSLGYELSYTNVLNMLDLAGIQVLSSERGDEYPLVIAGGCCTVNSEPMAEFIDAFAIGEGEELIHEIIDSFKANRANGKQSLLRELARIPGVYVPSLYEASYNNDGTVKEVRPTEADVPSVVRRRLVADFNLAEYAKAPVMPFVETVHDRIPLEVMRGCTRGCRFCQAGMIYRPVRERSAAKLMEQAETILRNTGYDEMSLMSLSTPDHSEIECLVRDLIAKYEGRKVGISLPSIRADAQCVGLAAEIQKVRKSGLTLAPEAGTQRMRDVINKDVTEEDLLAAVEAAFKCGWKRVKLYFMIGLPSETDDDLIGIAHLARDVYRVGRHMGFKPTVNASVASFVPKPQTPFQWRAQDSVEELERKQEVLRKAFREKHADLSWHDARTSNLEGVLARGDRRLGAAILAAWRAGCHFDAWDEHFDYDKWMDALAGEGLNPEFYANRERDYAEVLPWDHIDCGINKAFLVREDKRAKTGEVTGGCLEGCEGCGADELLADSLGARGVVCRK